MPRPKKAQDEKKDRRLTVYLSESEQDALRDVSDQQQRSMTQIVTDALRDWLLRLVAPPRELAQGPSREDHAGAVVNSQRLRLPERSLLVDRLV